jgi:cytoskeletal protein RodZ
MTAPRQSGHVGGKLREARERKGVSLRQIANATKISVGMLDALERNDIKRLPGGIFSRAFVRSFANEVGLDPEKMTQEFIAQFSDDSVATGAASTQIEDNEALESARRTASTFIILAAVSVPVVAVILYFSIVGRRAPPVTTERVPAAEQDRPAVAAPSPSTVVPDRASVPITDRRPAVETSGAERLTVNLVASRHCWISATVDGKNQVKRLLQAGDRSTFDVGRDLVLTTGDAGAVTMTVNGREARPLGKSGEVATTRLTLSNYTTFLTTR